MSEELRELAARWLRRRKRLGQRATDLSKIKILLNQLHARDFLGRFSEIDKCRSELVAIINRMDDKNNAAILKNIK